MHSPPRPPHHRAGFTLVELLITVGVVLLLAAITISAVQWTAYKEKPLNAANSVATYIKGARDRALHHRNVYGVRFVLDATGPTNAAGNPITVNTLEYVELPEEEDFRVSISMTDHRTLIFRTPGPDLRPGAAGVDDDGNGTPDDHTDELGFGDDIDTSAEFDHLDADGLWGDFFYARLNDVEYGVLRTAGGWALTTNWRAAVNSLAGHVDIRMEAQPSQPVIASEQEPRQLARGICIDLETMRLHGRLPSDWYDSAANAYDQDKMFVLFSRRGGVDGPYNAWGVITFLVARAEDVETTVQNATLYDPASRPDFAQERFVSIATRNGKAIVAEIHQRDSNNDGIWDDPFAYADGVQSP